MGHTVLAERIRELGWDRYKDMPAFNAYTAPPPNEDADDGRSAQRLCRDAHLAAESAASKAPEPAKRPPSARPSTRRRPPVNEDLTETEGQGSAQGAAAGAATGRPAGVLADPSRAHLAVRPEIMNKTPPRSHVRAMPVLSARVCVCVCGGALVLLRVDDLPWAHLEAYLWAQVSAGGFRGRRAGILAEGMHGGRGGGARGSEGGDGGGEQRPRGPPPGRRPSRGGGGKLRVCESVRLRVWSLGAR